MHGRPRPVSGKGPQGASLGPPGLGSMVIASTLVSGLPGRWQLWHRKMVVLGVALCACRSGAGAWAALSRGGDLEREDSSAGHHGQAWWNQRSFIGLHLLGGGGCCWAPPLSGERFVLPPWGNDLDGHPGLADSSPPGSPVLTAKAWSNDVALRWGLRLANLPGNELSMRLLLPHTCLPAGVHTVQPADPEAVGCPGRLGSAQG